MTNLKEDEIFAIADHFGLDPQLKQLIEELADVTLMLYQVVYLLGCDEVVGEIANKKVKRTLERI